MQKEVNVICIKWGTAYKPEYVNKLKNMISRNTSYIVNFYCFTDDSEGLDNEIIIKPLPQLNTQQEYQTKYAYRKEAGLCDDNLGNLNGKRVFFFDLDMVIISNLDEFFSFPQNDKFYIINDWNTKGDTVGQASCYSWVVGTLGYIKKYYEENPKKVVDKFFTASQEYLSSKIIEKYGKLNFWPDDWFCSFRFHCMPKFGPLRHFLVPKIPKNKIGLKAIAFHGVPNPKEAIDGVWLDKSGIKPLKSWKRLYKACLPTLWIKDYWY
ncbi:MAG TPA: hypothetical protein CFH82_03865 [Sulfurospirillum sp. UBA12182]|nr:MAG TPA: hypothetical protein CFH82_03865 [Sulfurospirillum sp. UBA12182]